MEKFTEGIKIKNYKGRGKEKERCGVFLHAFGEPPALFYLEADDDE